MESKLTFNNFKLLVGEVIGFCQTIESDLKVIFASVINGNFKEDLEFFKTWTLGQTVNEIDNFDQETQAHLFTNKEYMILKGLTKKRNYICHEIFRTFAYKTNFVASEEYAMACEVLLDFHEDVIEVAKAIEQVRINCQIKHTYEE